MKNFNTVSHNTTVKRGGETYRSRRENLFQYSAISGEYVHVFKNDRDASTEELVNIYEYLAWFDELPPLENRIKY